MKLYTAVIKEAQEQKKFSAHNLTQALRDKVNNSALVIEDVGQITHPVTGDTVADVPHNLVNETVKEIFDTQVLPLKREFAKGYYLYSLEDAQVTTAAKAPLVFVPTIGGLSQQAAAKLPASFGQLIKLPTNDLESKVRFYVDNKKQTNQPATLRGIHSSIKTKGVKIVDISHICNKLGFSVTHKTPTYQSEVK
jgi:hypothetical protein